MGTAGVKTMIDDDYVKVPSVTFYDDEELTIKLPQPVYFNKYKLRNLKYEDVCQYILLKSYVETIAELQKEINELKERINQYELRE
jgi:hypothetical protein